MSGKTWSAWTLALLCFALLQSSCSTFFEAASPTDTTAGYQQTTNSKGQTVYHRERVLPGYVEPTPTPTPTPIAVTALAPVEKAAPPPSKTDSQGTSGFFISGELAGTGDYKLIGVDIGREVLDFLDLRGGVALFFGSDAYAGFDLGARAKLKFGFAQPFVGLGGYLGDLKHCDDDGYVEVCEKKFLSAGFTEAGISLFGVALFFRDYNIEDAGKKIPSAYIYGVDFTHRW